MSDVAAPAFDRTESTRVLSPGSYQEQPLTLQEHSDTDKHWIGESLPVPSASMMRGSGSVADPGKMPFVARADHTHTLNMVYGVFTSTNKVVAPGNVYINTLVYSGWGKNMLASAQIVAFPTSGMYLIEMGIVCNRQGGGYFVGDMNVVYTYNNGGASRYWWRAHTGGQASPAQMSISTSAVVTTTAPSTNDNFQIAVQHNDSVSWDVYLEYLTVLRVSDLTSA